MFCLRVERVEDGRRKLRVGDWRAVGWERSRTRAAGRLHAKVHRTGAGADQEGRWMARSGWAGGGRGTTLLKSGGRRRNGRGREPRGECRATSDASSTMSSCDREWDGSLLLDRRLSRENKRISQDSGKY